MTSSQVKVSLKPIDVHISGLFQSTDSDDFFVIGIRDQKAHEEPEEPQCGDLQLCREPAAQSLQHLPRPAQSDHLLERRAASHLWRRISEVRKGLFLFLRNVGI